jgi:hypothetical protein
VSLGVDFPEAMPMIHLPRPEMEEHGFHNHHGLVVGYSIFFFSLPSVPHHTRGRYISPAMLDIDMDHRRW